MIKVENIEAILSKFSFNESQFDKSEKIKEIMNSIYTSNSQDGLSSHSSKFKKHISTLISSIKDQVFTSVSQIKPKSSKNRLSLLILSRIYIHIAKQYKLFCKFVGDVFFENLCVSFEQEMNKFVESQLDIMLSDAVNEIYIDKYIKIYN